MFQVTIDGTLYQSCSTEAEAEAVRATMRRWSSNSTRIAVVPVAAAPCAVCNGTGTAARLTWVGSRGGWVSAPGPCRTCGGSGSVPAPAAAA